MDWFSAFGHRQTIKNIVENILFELSFVQSLDHSAQEKGSRGMTFKGALMNEQDFQQWQRL